jgi:nucleoside-diphosphate-sugar epimerase
LQPLKILLFGATGMVGAGALLECLADDRVKSVLSISRSPTGRSHPHLRELIRSDFFHYDDLRTEFAAIDACFFCLGVSSVGMAEPRTLFSLCPSRQRTCFVPGSFSR